MNKEVLHNAGIKLYKKIKKSSKMTTPDFNTTFSVDQTPNEVFNAVNNVRGWWSERIDGGTEQLNDEFTYQRWELHKCTMKLIEVVPDKKVV